MVVADMGSLESVRAAVDQVLATEARLDVVIDNAGAIFAERTIGPDGIESTFATLVVGPFVLVGGLLPLLRRTPGARVIAVASGGQYAQALDLDDLEFASGGYDGTRAYARAKRAQVSLIREWARRLGATGIRFDSMHPGWADTPGLADALPGFARLMAPVLRTPAEGVDTLIWLATAPDVDARHGSFWLDRRPRPFDRVPMTRLSRADRRHLWDLVVESSGAPDPAPDGVLHQ
jgi:NAD(P)-dependent dehydrogenase (short-subunit alcohol dehydrogenase family)